MSSDLDEAFAIWLASRRIVTRQHKPYLCFDSRILTAKGSAVLGNAFKIKHYLYDQQIHQGEFSTKATEIIEQHLQELERYTVQSLDCSDFVNKIKDRCDEVEPIWSSVSYVNPADYLVPPTQQLLVDQTLPKTDAVFFTPYAHHGLGFKNNLACVYGKWILMADKDVIEIHDLNCLLLEKTQWKEIKLRISLKSCKNHAKFQSDKELNKENIDLLFREDNFQVNFMKVTKFFGSDVLICCLDGGVVVLYEMDTLLNSVKDVTKSKILQKKPFLSAIPILILKTPDSCWSVDAIDKGSVTYLAAGHNGPGVTIFAFLEGHMSLQPIDTYQISSFHNVPNLNFVARSDDKNGSVVLAFCSIYGNVTTIKFKLNPIDGKIRAQALDSQFFAAFCWTVTPLSKGDFLKVPEFELLNLNYQTSFKSSILYSATQDSLIFGCHPPSVYCSGEIGIGGITTQIPVPVAPLEWGCQNGITNSLLGLRFTSFDKAGIITKSHLKPEGASSVISGYGPLFQLTRSSEPNLAERIYMDVPADMYRHYYMFERASLQTEHLNCEPCKKYENFHFNRAQSHHTEVSNCPNYKVWSGPLDEWIVEKPYHSHLLNEAYNLKCRMPTKVVVYSPAKSQAVSISDICGFTLAESFTDLADNCETWNVSNAENSSIPSQEPSPVDGLLAAGHIEEQPKWALHNHVRKVRHLLNLVEPESTSSPSGYRLSELNDDFFFVTTAHHIYLVKAHPLIVTSFTRDRIFPVSRITLCSCHEVLMALDRINIVCHIKEFHCMVVASQVGLLSLLRLTEYNGIYSFRQEYILGWNSQNAEDPDAQCILCYTNPGTSCRYCGIDDVILPFYHIVGLDYSYVPKDTLNCIGPYAILYVLSRNFLHRIKIAPSW
ncbi:BN860_09582g1_1 [Zygosaccharomyces bailii CLIB 213]|uniref:BN860_09582g1_1 n=1 Tax=Zygosaccharomyces bailii (strain CLIB 213 / ATCC 58445 / CBS 680 / BCRC 21525 / NBRC 1098 / NCYC 1416 / NRRL Y-2227) TaxID=1333698 RepID=A0A8J2T1V3_ZYGB2|nr:BN860_09582g1_1 [Zygosaccharomyces bailii CLIB 213]